MTLNNRNELSITPTVNPSGPKTTSGREGIVTVVDIIPIRQPTFEERASEIQRAIAQRKRKWTLTTMSWEDTAQLLLIRVWKKYHLFDPTKAPFEHWLNRLLSHAIKNLLRDNLLRWQRPCIRDGGCVHNLGMGHCSYTVNGNQCSLCPLYSTWKAKKESEYNVRSSLTLENHSQEVSNLQGDFLDIEAAKKVIDAKMLKRLTAWERRVYRALHIRHMTPLETAAMLKAVAAKRKRPLEPTDPVDYQGVLKMAKDFKAMMITIIRNEDLC
jgi:DNA-directed RNA polymerase specialized sigma24 family protein